MNSHVDRIWVALIFSINRLQVVAVNERFPGPVINSTTNNNVVVNVRNDLDEDLLMTWSVSAQYHFVSALFFSQKFYHEFVFGVLINLGLMVAAGQEFKCGVIHGRMVCLPQIVQFTPNGIGHISFKSRIKLGAISTSRPSIFREHLGALVLSLLIIGI